MMLVWARVVVVEKVKSVWIPLRKSKVEWHVQGLIKCQLLPSQVILKLLFYFIWRKESVFSLLFTPPHFDSIPGAIRLKKGHKCTFSPWISSSCLFSGLLSANALHIFLAPSFHHPNYPYFVSSVRGCDSKEKISVIIKSIRKEANEQRWGLSVSLESLTANHKIYISGCYWLGL